MFVESSTVAATPSDQSMKIFIAASEFSTQTTFGPNGFATDPTVTVALVVVAVPDFPHNLGPDENEIDGIRKRIPVIQIFFMIPFQPQ